MHIQAPVPTRHKCSDQRTQLLAANGQAAGAIAVSENHTCSIPVLCSLSCLPSVRIEGPQHLPHSLMKVIGCRSSAGQPCWAETTLFQTLPR